MADNLIRHPGHLCTGGDRAVDLALDLGRAQQRIAELEAQAERVRALHKVNSRTTFGWCLYEAAPWPCPTIRALDEVQADD